MRLLFIHADVDHMSPLYRMWTNVFKYIPDTTTDFFGPGFSPEFEIKKGLSNYIAEKGPFDIIIGTDLGLIKTKSDINRVTSGVYRYNKEVFKLMPNIYEELISYKGKKVICILSDYYEMTSEYISWLQNLVNSETYIIALGEQFIRPISECPLIEKESFSNRFTDHWITFVEKNKERVISLPSFVSSYEFCYSSILTREHRWNVQGTEYYCRREAAKLLKNKGVKPLNNKSLRWLVRFRKLFGKRSYDDMTIVGMLQESFRENIRNSKFSYICGSGGKCPVRKFFEVPAMGSLLVCYPCNGFEDLGFVNNYNAIICNPENILEIENYSHFAEENLSIIAKRGQELVRNKHSEVARAAQLKDSFESILNGTFKGSYWKDGDFIIRKNDYSC